MANTDRMRAQTGSFITSFEQVQHEDEHKEGTKQHKANRKHTLKNWRLAPQQNRNSLVDFCHQGRGSITAGVSLGQRKRVRSSRKDARRRKHKPLSNITGVSYAHCLHDCLNPGWKPPPQGHRLLWSHCLSLLHTDQDFFFPPVNFQVRNPPNPQLVSRGFQRSTAF